MATKPMMETGEKYQDMNLDEKQQDTKEALPYNMSNRKKQVRITVYLEYTNRL